MNEPTGEVLLKEVLEAFHHLPVSLSVPSPRPQSFLTVERVGGGAGANAHLIDRPLLAVQCWAPTRIDASGLAGNVADTLRTLKGCTVNSVSNFPDDKQPRYQVLVELIVKH